MWLPKEERRLLMFYTACDPNFSGHLEAFSRRDLQGLVTERWITTRKIVNRAGEWTKKKKNHAQLTDQKADQNSDLVGGYFSRLRATATIESANNRLQERHLIEAHEGCTGYYQIKMNLAGWDLGNKYKSLPQTIYLWCTEYPLIPGFLAGILGGILVNSLSR